MKSFHVLAILIFTAASARAGNQFTPNTVEKDIPYVVDGHPAQTLDLYLPPGSFVPARSSEKLRPPVVWIHRGAGKSGAKDWITVKYLVAHGFALASVG